MDLSLFLKDFYKKVKKMYTWKKPFPVPVKYTGLYPSINYSRTWTSIESERLYEKDVYLKKPFPVPVKYTGVHSFIKLF